MISRGLFLFILFVASMSRATIQIPTALTHDDREQALRIIGLGMGEKLLSDPYPLGGYAGFELGLSLENLPTDTLSRLGAKLPSPQEDITYPKLTVGKGVYNNLDFFVQFTPYRRVDELTQFGGMVRWGFYQGQLFPFSTSLLVHANSSNVSNLIITRTYGADLMAGVSVGKVSIFGGLGVMQSYGLFTGGANGITSSTNAEEETVLGFHSFVGANLRLFEKAFLAVQLDRTEVPVVSGKFGVRF
jgi:hypothetical protein